MFSGFPYWNTQVRIFFMSIWSCLDVHKFCFCNHPSMVAQTDCDYCSVFSCIVANLSITVALIHLSTFRLATLLPANLLAWYLGTPSCWGCLSAVAEIAGIICYHGNHPANLVEYNKIGQTPGINFQPSGWKNHQGALKWNTETHVPVIRTTTKFIILAKWRVWVPCLLFCYL